MQSLSALLEHIQQFRLVPFLVLILVLLLLLKYGLNILGIVYETFKENPMLIVIGVILIGLILWILL